MSKTGRRCRNEVGGTRVVRGANVTTSQVQRRADKGLEESVVIRIGYLRRLLRLLNRRNRARSGRAPRERFRVRSALTVNKVL